MRQAHKSDMFIQYHLAAILPILYANYLANGSVLKSGISVPGYVTLSIFALESGTKQKLESFWSMCKSLFAERTANFEWQSE